MATKVADIRAELSLEIAQFKKDLSTAKRTMKTASAGMSKDIGGLKNQIGNALGTMKGLAAGALAVAGVGGLGALITSSVNAADTIGKVSKKIGLTTDELQEFRFAAAQASVKQETLDMGMQRFSRRVAEAQKNTGELNGTLKQYGIAVFDANGKNRRTVDVLGDLANVISNTEDEQEKLRISFKAFDSEGAAMVNMLQDGSAGLDEMRKRAHELGTVMDAELIEQAEKASSDFSALSMILKTNVTRAIIGLLPEINSLTDAFLKDKSAMDGMKESGVILGNILKGLGFLAGTTKNVFEIIGQTAAAGAAGSFQVLTGNMKEAQAVGSLWAKDTKGNVTDITSLYGRLFGDIEKGETAQAERRKQTKGEVAGSAGVIDLTTQLGLINQLVSKEKELAGIRVSANEKLFNEMGLESEAYFQDQADGLINQAIKWKKAGVNVESVNKHLSTNLESLADKARAAGVWSLDELINSADSTRQTMLEYFEEMKASAVDDLSAIGEKAKELEQDIEIRVSIFDRASNQIDSILNKIGQLRAAGASTASTSFSSFSNENTSNDIAPFSRSNSVTYNINEKLSRNDVANISQVQKIEGNRG